MGVNEIVTPFLVVIIPNISWDEFLLYYDRLECAEMSKDSRGKKKKKLKKGRHAEYGYNPTTPQWQNKLAGQDLLGFSQAFMAMGVLRLEYGILGPFRVRYSAGRR